MNSVGDAFGFAFRDPAWLGKIVVQGLITIIPIVGWIATAGWLMLAFDSARSGRNELPQAGFHLGRGIGIFGVLLIYGIVLNIPTFVLNGIGGHTVDMGNGVTYSTGSPLGNLWQLLASLFLDFLTPTLIVMVYHHGFGGGLRPRQYLEVRDEQRPEQHHRRACDLRERLRRRHRINRLLHRCLPDHRLRGFDRGGRGSLVREGAIRAGGSGGAASGSCRLTKTAL